MTPTEKAKQLVDRFYYMLPNNGSYSGINNVESRYNEAKQCALIAVDEILFVVRQYNDTQAEFTYWKELKDEIEKL
jgi:hypothetical protein